MTRSVHCDPVKSSALPAAAPSQLIEVGRVVPPQKDRVLAYLSQYPPTGKVRGHLMGRTRRDIGLQVQAPISIMNMDANLKLNYITRHITRCRRKELENTREMVQTMPKPLKIVPCLTPFP